MIQSPCKRNKCIIYPACINKKLIRCNSLWSYFKYLNIINEIESAGWKIIRMDFPLLELVYPATYQRPEQ